MQNPEAERFEPFEINRAAIYAGLLEGRPLSIYDDWRRVLIRKGLMSISKDLKICGREPLVEVLDGNENLRKLVMRDPEILNQPEYLSAFGRKRISP